MSAPRTSAAIADDLAEWRKGVSSQPLKAVIMEAIAALRKDHPALPADVEAVVAELDEVTAESTGLVPADFEDNDSDHAESLADLVERLTHGCNSAATLLRRYAQAVAENDAKLQAVEALCAKAEAMQPPTLVGPQSILIAKIRKTLREEH